MEKLCLENYGVQELSAIESEIINGRQETEPPPGWDPSQETVWLGTISNMSALEKAGFNFGYFCSRFLRNAVEGFLPF